MDVHDRLASSYAENHSCRLKLRRKTLTRLHAPTRATEWFKRLVAYAKCNRDSFETIQVEVRGVVLGQNLATGKHFKSGLVGYHAEDDDGMVVIVDVARGSTWSMA
ncbi:hypothetical protein Tco_0571184 [Tanacetum coccineum]